ncbi:methyl-accepting chemotaxis protein [Buttiauxella sp. A111]|nr:methyl-accepting chemotaxis protein [Buttiauxella sp. A111]GDX05297.1 methyl-accepting chemotaxis protein [Buttiauxella sp. A111]
MLRNLKISQVLIFIAAVFTLFFLSACMLNVWNAKQAQNNYSKLFDQAGSAFYLQNAVIDINRVRGRLADNQIRMRQGQEIGDGELEFTRKILAESLISFNLFAERKFSDREEDQAQEVIKLYREIYAYSAHRLADANARKIMESLEERETTNSLRDRLSSDVADYISYINQSTDQNAEYNRYHYQLNLKFNLLLLLLMVSFLILSWFWVQETIFQRLQIASKNFRKISSGNLSEPIVCDKRDEIGEMFIELENMRESLKRTVTHVLEGTHQLNVIAGQVSAGNDELSNRTERQATAVQQTAASMEQIKVTVKLTADNANLASDLSGGSCVMAKNGSEMMAQIIVSMKNIATNSHKIGEINSVIDSIAHQTNILALNAAVEAARAGEQGRGFAVVAAEVRTLARRSAEAAKEIRELITTSVEGVKAGALQVEIAGNKMEEIVEFAEKVSEIMGEINIAAREQSIGIDQIAQAVTEMETVTQQNAALVVESLQASNHMLRESNRLDEAVAVFKV